MDGSNESVSSTVGTIYPLVYKWLGSQIVQRPYYFKNESHSQKSRLNDDKKEAIFRSFFIFKKINATKVQLLIGLIH